jgi:hypothetical protein
LVALGEEKSRIRGKGKIEQLNYEIKSKIKINQSESLKTT